MRSGGMQKWGISLILVGTLCLTGCNGKNAAEGDTVAVQSVSMLAGLDSTLTLDKFAGKVVSQKVVEVKKDANKKIDEIKVAVGDEVKKGDVLFTYDLDEINRSIESAELELEKMRNENEMMIRQRDNLVKEKEKAAVTDQLSYTMEIQEQEINIKENEYKITSKEKEIENLKAGLEKSEVKAEIEGVIQTVNSGDGQNDNGYNEYSDFTRDSGSTSDAFITIMQTGSYRIKGQINEQNMGYLREGMNVIIHSRVDDAITWTGVISLIDTSKADTENNNNYNYYDTDAYTSSTKYAFYVELDSLDGLMIGQHVFIEPDMGQNEEKEGIWLSSFYLDMTDIETTYAWIASDKDKLVKQELTLGEYDANLDEYEIVEGLTADDYIAIPDASLEEGMPVTRYDDFYFDDGNYDDYEFESGNIDGEMFFDEDGNPIYSDEMFFDEDGNPIFSDENFNGEGFDVDGGNDQESIDGLDAYLESSAVSVKNN